MEEERQWSENYMSKLPQPNIQRLRFDLGKSELIIDKICEQKISIDRGPMIENIMKKMEENKPGLTDNFNYLIANMNDLLSKQTDEDIEKRRIQLYSLLEDLEKLINKYKEKIDTPIVEIMSFVWACYQIKELEPINKLMLFIKDLSKEMVKKIDLNEETVD